MKRTLKDREENKSIAHEVYDNIEECPIWNYNKAKLGNLAYLYQLDSYKNPHECDEKIIDAWSNINAEIIDRFGFSDEQKALLYKEKQIELLRIDLILTKNRTLITRIKIAQKQYLKMLEKASDTNQTFEDQVAIIEQHRGISLDPKKTSILMWFTYRDLYDKYIENAKKQEAKRKNK